MFVFIVIVWLSAQGTIEASATGAAADVVSCEKLAEKNIADNANDPRLQGLTPKYSCWDTRPVETGGNPKLEKAPRHKADEV
jgi:hypothetical protein